MCHNFYCLIKVIVFLKFWAEESWNSNNNFYRLWFRYKDTILLSKPGPSHLHPNISENNIIEAKEGRINRMRISVVKEIVRLFPKLVFLFMVHFGNFHRTIKKYWWHHNDLSRNDFGYQAKNYNKTLKY